MKSYKEFIITAEPFISEIISGILWELNIDGVNEEVNCIRVFASVDGPSLEEINKQLDKLCEQNMLRSFFVEENIVEGKNWNEEWENSINIIKVTDKIIIKPTFRNYEASEDEIVLIIDPKMSFGTGEHQTTKLMLRLIEKYVKNNSKVLDIGSGTAVLAIAALKLGAGTAVAVDIDEWCLENAKENVRLNHVADKIEILMGELNDVREDNFDMILANIQKNVLLNISSEMKRKIKKDGTLIISGLLNSDEKDIVNSYDKAGFTLVELLQMDEWIAIVFVVSE